MTYIENIYICLAAPLFISILIVRKSWRRALVFLLLGMTCCVVSAYISSFAAGILGADNDMAACSVSPLVEELIKYMPILFYRIIFKPEKRNSLNSILMVAAGFATFENVCYLTANGSSDLIKLLIRGFGTGAMHVVCGVMLSVGMFLLWDSAWLRPLGIIAVLGMAITFHAIFNIVVSAPGIWCYVGSAFTISLILVYLIFLKGKLSDTEKKIF